jgi:hypothetical protein
MGAEPTLIVSAERITVGNEPLVQLGSQPACLRGTGYRDLLPGNQQDAQCTASQGIMDGSKRPGRTFI